jgi:hypothetical protein
VKDNLKNIMASATGIPESTQTSLGLGEDEPLLGRIGDASQPEGRPIYYNLIIGKHGYTLMKTTLLTAL